MRRTVLISSVAVALAVPAVAQAHVTLQPSTAAAGGYTRLDVRVPNERDDASTTKVQVQFPEGFASASYEPVPGWDVKVTKAKLATPIQTDDGEITEGVSEITWTADGEDSAIPPGAFEDFGLSVKIPDQAGTLTFKALQTYSDGDVVRWIGEEGSDHPAPTVTVTAATADQHGTTHSDEATPTPEPTEVARTSATSATPSDDGDSNALVIVALILGAAGLIAGLAGLRAGRSGS